MKPTKLIINRQKAGVQSKAQRKPCLKNLRSLFTAGGEIDYAYAVKLSGDWILQQNYCGQPLWWGAYLD